jgi:caprin-1
MPIAQSSSRNQTNTNKSTKQHKLSESVEPEQKMQHEQTPTANSGTKTPPEQPEFVKQTLVIIEKKVRNLDKRRQKLEEYKENARKGATLNEDQLQAVSKYDEVIRTLELTREMEKQFVGLANDTMKQQKKQMKKDQIVREEELKERLRECHRYFSLLEKLGDETIRNYFLTNSYLTEEELTTFDEFNKLVETCTPGTKLEAASNDFAEHLAYLIDGRNKPVLTLTHPCTYSELKKLFERLLSCPYWTEEPKVEEPVVETPVAVENSTEATEPVVATEEPASLNQAVESLQLNEQQHVAQQQQQQNEQGNYQQNVEDFVIVSSSECAESLCHSSKSPSLQPQTLNGEQQQMPMPQDGMTQSQTKTFFSTLNQPAEQRQNIKEFINNCENNGEGINFFQDSELSSRQQHEQHFQQQQQQGHQNHQQHQGNDFNHQPSDQHRDQGFKGQRGGNRGYQSRNPDDRRNGNQGGQQGPRGNGQNSNNRGPRGTGYGPNNGPRGAGGNSRGGYRGGQNGGSRPQNNNYRQQPQQRGNFNNEMHEQMAN